LVPLFEGLCIRARFRLTSSESLNEESLLCVSVIVSERKKCESVPIFPNVSHCYEVDCEKINHSKREAIFLAVFKNVIKVYGKAQPFCYLGDSKFYITICDQGVEVRGQFNIITVNCYRSTTCLTECFELSGT
jgi:hypothetical protein